MRTIFLVSCVSKKKRGKHPAKDIYDSTLFKKARACVEVLLQETDSWFILSAKHGLLCPDELIVPYDMACKDMTPSQRRQWADRVLLDLRSTVESGDRVVMFAGECYRKFLMGGLTEMGLRVEVPMEGMRIGEQLRWLSQQRGGNNDR